jgi:hypothetical protein
MHDVVVVGIPLVAILAGILFNRSDVAGLRSEFRSDVAGLRSELKDIRYETNSGFNKVEDHLGRIDADLRQFYHLTGKLEARMDAIEKRS